MVRADTVALTRMTVSKMRHASRSDLFRRVDDDSDSRGRRLRAAGDAGDQDRLGACAAEKRPTGDSSRRGFANLHCRPCRLEPARRKSTLQATLLAEALPTYTAGR